MRRERSAEGPLEPNEPDSRLEGKQREIEAARDRAEAYRQQQNEISDAATVAETRRTRSESEWRDFVSQAIEEAMSKGAFDNLRGRGKPIPPRDRAFTPPGAELAYDILKNNDLAPGWIGVRNDVRREVEAWRMQLRAEAERTTAAWIAAGDNPAAQEAVRTRWSSKRAPLVTALEALNRRIRDANLQQPISTLHLIMLRMAEEEARTGLPAPLV